MLFAKCEIPLFDRHVLAVIECSEEEALLFFTEHLNKKSSGCFAGLEELTGCKGWAQCCKGDFYLWAKDSYAVLYHEIVHAAFKLCHEVDIAIDEELIARLVEHMKINLVDELS